MSWQDVMGHYVERDDDPEPAAVELIDHPCPGCGKPVQAPIDADGDDLCCSSECVGIVCARLDAEIAAMRAAEEAERAGMPGWVADDDVPY